MTCAEFQDAVADLIEDRLDPRGRAALEAHAESCPACKALAADLREIRQVARALERHAPPRGGWARLAERIQAEPGLLAGPAASSRLREHATRRPWGWVALAASLAALVGTALFFVTRAGEAPPERSTTTASAPASGNAPASPLVESVESEVQLAAEHLEKAASGLEQLASQADATVDPEVMAKLKQSLAVIDQAIGDSRTALRTQPENRVAQESLFDAFRRKVSLLQDTIALMNEMRKGNQAGAARIAETDKS